MPSEASPRDRGLSAFLAREASDISATVDGGDVTIGAIGTVAEDALSSACNVGRQSHRRFRGIVHRDLAALMANPEWQLALVLSPFKSSAAQYCDYLAPQAARIGAVDTLVRSSGTMYGLNANSYAIAAASSYLPHGVTLVVGTGATASSAVAGLSNDSRRTIQVVGRSYPNTVNLVDSVDAGQPLRDIAEVVPDLVIHATTVGEVNDDATLDLPLDRVLGLGTGFLDLNSRVTALQHLALSRGCIVMSGALTQLFTNSMRLALIGADLPASAMPPASGAP
jgi:shikimate dehydrogenase